MGQLDAEKGSCVGGNGTSQSRSEAREKGSVSALSVEVTNDTAKRDVALGGLQARLDGVDGEDGDPHGHTGSGTGAGNGRQAQLAGGLSGDGILGAQDALDVLVGGEVGGRSGTITSKCGHAAAEDAAQASLGVQLADDVDTTVVLGLLAWRKLLLALDLQNDLDALKGRGDGRHGNRREETSRGDLGDGEAVRADGGRGRDDLLAEVVAPEGDGNWRQVTEWEKSAV